MSYIDPADYPNLPSTFSINWLHKFLPVFLSFKEDTLLDEEQKQTLNLAINWLNTEQGHQYWYTLYEGERKVSKQDIEIIHKWFETKPINIGEYL